MMWHVTLSSVRRENLFPRRADRVEMARAVVRIEAAEVALFCAVDDHLHLVVEGEDLGCLGGALRRRLARRHPVNPAHFKPVAGRRHLLTLVDYLLRQPAKHGLGAHPALWEGSCFPDLVGARRMGFDTGPLERALPRLPLRDFLAPVGLREAPRPLPPDALAGLGLLRLERAVAAAAGLDTLRSGRAADVVEARRTLGWLARRAGIPPAALTATLGLPARTARRLHAQPEEPPLGAAARTWLHVEALVVS